MRSHHTAVNSILLLYFLLASSKSLFHLCIFSCGITFRKKKKLHLLKKKKKKVRKKIIMCTTILSQHMDAVFPVSLQCWAGWCQGRMPGLTAGPWQVNSLVWSAWACRPLQPGDTSALCSAKRVAAVRQQQALEARLWRHSDLLQMGPDFDPLHRVRPYSWKCSVVCHTAVTSTGSE